MRNQGRNPALPRNNPLQSSGLVLPVRRRRRFQPLPPRDFLECVLQQGTLFLPHLPPCNGDVPERDEDGQARECEANGPEQNEREFLQPLPQHRLAGNQHRERRQETKRTRPAAAHVGFAAHAGRMTKHDLEAENIPLRFRPG